MQNSDLNNSTLSLAFLDRMWFNVSGLTDLIINKLRGIGVGVDFRALDGTFNSYRILMDGANFELFNLSGKHMRESSFIGANFKGANLTKIDLTQISRTANFNGTNL